MAALETFVDRITPTLERVPNLSFILLIIVALIYLLYCTGLVIYRLFLSPLSRFPGPKLAAVTDWYEVYFDLFANGGEGGQFTWHIKRLHEQYGPIVRITPQELHIDDPNYYNEVYCASTPSRPMDKSLKFKYRFGIPDATFSTTYAEQHRERRAALNPFFSKQRIRSLHSKLSEITERISDRLSTDYAGTSKVLNVSDMWSALGMDAVSTLAFARPINCSAAPDFMSPLSTGLQNLMAAAHWNAHFKFLNDMMSWVPDSILGAMLPPFKPILEFRASFRAQVADILDGKASKSTDNHTLFHDIVNSKLPRSELTLERLTDEAISVNGAGMETTKWTLTVATFHVLDNPSIQACLKTELSEAMPDPKAIRPWDELEKLPYLSAVIAEGLRLSYGQVQRIPRVNRLQSWRFGDWEIPPGVTVGMDAYHMHSKESIFPEPQTFRPERWLGSPKGPDGVTPLSNYLVSFSRGSRACIGLNLAYMELYVALATIFRRFELELFDTDRSDVDFIRDVVVPMPKRDSKGVRVLVKK
ncbi:putative cytochrome P450 [Viridothelium virens]|uniref:Putative cytochrome P450 n=1 Tax=Viridothelium virens TaxID=1048519 RepID=A0A6A6H0E6_VIRVR|nr:putative cytochrome P450 [Viridothelium virens]